MVIKSYNTKAMKKWLEKNYVINFKEDQEKIEKYIKGEDIALSSIARSLYMMANWLIHKHTVELYEEEEKKTTESLYDVINYVYMSIKLYNAVFYFKKYGQSGRGYISFNEAGITLSRLLTLGLFDKAEDIFNLIIKGLKNKLFYGVTMTMVTPFILQLFMSWKNLNISLKNYKLKELQDYEKLLDNWQTQDIKKLENIIKLCCDLHIQRTIDTNRDIGEFSRNYYAVYPSEILSVLRIRESLNLPNPIIDHRLMNSPLGKLYPIKEIPYNPFLEKLKKKLNKDLPNWETRY